MAGAWEILSDPAKRKAFDSGRGGGGAYRDSRDVFREFFGGGCSPVSLPFACSRGPLILLEPWSTKLATLFLFDLVT